MAAAFSFHVWKTRAWRVMGIALLLLAGAPPAAVNALPVRLDPDPPQLGVMLSQSAVEGTGFAMGANASLKINNPANGAGWDYQDTKVVTEAPWGGQSYVWFDIPPEFPLAAGYQVLLTDGSAVKTHTIQNLSISQADTDLDMVFGEADAGVRVDVYGWNTPGHIWNGRHLYADSGGMWTANYHVVGDGGEPVLDLRPGSEGVARRVDDEEDYTEVQWRVPNMQIFAEPWIDKVTGYEWPLGTTVTLTIDDPGTGPGVDFTASAESVPDTWWLNRPAAAFEFWEDFDLRPGMEVSLSGAGITRTLTVADLVFTRADAGLDQVEGTAEPGSLVMVDYGDNCNIARWVTADSGGHWTADFSTTGVLDFEQTTLDIQAGTGGWVMQEEADRDTTAVFWRVYVPFIQVEPSAHQIRAYDWPEGSLLTLTLDDPSNGPGVDTSAVSATVWDDPWHDHTLAVFWIGDFDLAPGVEVQVTDGETTRTHVITHLTGGGASESLETVWGRASPGSEVLVWVGGQNYAERHVTADGNGDWTADFSTPESADGPGSVVVDFQPGASGQAQQIDGENNATLWSWRILDVPWVSVSLNENLIESGEWLDGQSVQLTIDDPSTPQNPDFSRRSNASHVPEGPEYNFVQFNNFNDPYLYKAGDIVHITDGERGITYTVEPLEVLGYDLLADTVWGRTNPNRRVIVEFYGDGTATRLTTADGSGNWLVDFSTLGVEDMEQNLFDLKAGMNGNAFVFNGDQGRSDLRLFLTDFQDLPASSLVFGVETNFNPEVCDSESTALYAQLMESLFIEMADGDLMPAAAVGMAVSGDGLTVTVGLRPEAKWSDGQPVTAQHFVDGFLRLLDADMGSDMAELLFLLTNAQAYYEGTVTDPNLVGVHAVGPLTLQFSLTERAAYFGHILSHSCLVPARLDLIQQHGEDWNLPENLASNGPYRLESAQADEWVLNRNPHYWNAGRVAFAQTAFRQIPARGDLAAAYRSGKIDVYQNVFTAYAFQPDLQTDLVSGPLMGLHLVAFNVQKSPTDQVLVRKALASAVDRGQVLAALGTPWRPAATGVLLPTMPEFQTVGYPYNPDQARAYLAAAGYPGGVGFPELVLYANDNNQMIYEAVAAQWRSVLNIPVRTVYYYNRAYFRHLRACFDDPAQCDQQAFRSTWYLDYADPDNILYGLLDPASPWATFAKLFPTGWNSPAYHTLVMNSRGEMDETQRTADLRAAEKKVVEEDAVVLPLFFHETLYLVKPGILPMMDTYTLLASRWGNADSDGDGQHDLLDPCPLQAANTCEPTDSAASVITPAGGSFQSASGAVELSVPAGALTTEATLTATSEGTLRLSTPLGLLETAATVQLGPAGTQFAAPVTVTLRWEDDTNNGVVDGTWLKEEDLILYKNGQPLTARCAEYSGCDMQLNQISVPVTSFSQFALGALLSLPQIESLSGPEGVYPVGSEVSVQAVLENKHGLDWVEGRWYWGDGSSSPATRNVTSMTDTHTYTSGGMHRIQLRLSYGSGPSLIRPWRYAVVVDPKGDALVGSGRIQSPAGAVAALPKLSGPAQFQISARNTGSRIEPQGSFRFSLPAARLTLVSTQLDWLAVKGKTAYLQGSAKINGKSGYTFLVSAADQNRRDRVRVRIWRTATQEVLYDSRWGAELDADPGQTVGPGTVIIYDRNP